MSDNLKKVIQTLYMVAKVRGKKKREALLRGMSKDPSIYLALQEIAYNTLNKNIKLTLSHHKRLRGYKRLLEELANGIKAKYKKRAVVQSGGFLPVLIQTIPLLPSHVVLLLQLFYRLNQRQSQKAD